MCVDSDAVLLVSVPDEVSAGDRMHECTRGGDHGHRQGHVAVEKQG